MRKRVLLKNTAILSATLATTASRSFLSLTVKSGMNSSPGRMKAGVW